MSWYVLVFHLPTLLLEGCALCLAISTSAKKAFDREDTECVTNLASKLPWTVGKYNSFSKNQTRKTQWCHLFSIVSKCFKCARFQLDSWITAPVLQEFTSVPPCIGMSEGDFSVIEHKRMHRSSWNQDTSMFHNRSGWSRKENVQIAWRLILPEVHT